MKNWLIIIGIIIVAIVLAFGFLNLKKPTSKEVIKMDNTNTTTYANSSDSPSEVTPLSHASMVLNLNNKVIYNDPVGTDLFAGQLEPNIILISDIHPDHLDAVALSELSKENTIIVVPKAVADLLPDDLLGKVVVLGNGEKVSEDGIEIEAIPMYNIPQSPTTFHTKGRGNGYVLEFGGKRIYIAGDTSATPEMEALKNIDEAFIPMNLPYTMDVEEAAKGVLAFKPKLVHPYHYRGPDGLSDINKFKQLVEKENPNIKVELLNFYPQGK